MKSSSGRWSSTGDTIPSTDAAVAAVPPQYAPTMRELMSHNVGFTYGFLGSTPVDNLLG
jgi:hypothetical protein